MYETISTAVDKHERWRASCLNLIASENLTSDIVRRILASDLGHRYTLPFAGGTFEGLAVDNAYRGTRYLDYIELEGTHLAKTIYQSQYATLRPLGGHIAAMLALTTLCRRGDTVATISPRYGGYDGYAGPYLPDLLGLRALELPFDTDRWSVDAQATAALIESQRPAVVVLGQSYFPFPYDLAPIAAAARSSGTTLAYDGSHVMGLIGGNEFQRPLQDGCQVLMGSTHKTLFGPQGGMLLANGKELGARFDANTTWRTIDNAHWNRIAALTEALLELQTYGCAYAVTVVRNAQALARALHERGVPVRFAEHGFTASHQVLLDGPGIAQRYGTDLVTLSKTLEGQNLIIDSFGRLGVPEITRLGFKPTEMDAVAALLQQAMAGHQVGDQVSALRAGRTIHYCFANP